MKERFLKWIEHLTPAILVHGARILIVLAVGFILSKIAKKFIGKAVRVAVKPDRFSSKEAEIQRENTLIRIFSATIGVTITTIVVIMILQELGVMVGPLLAGAGIVGLAFGFGGQYVIRDIIAGLFIILENQYRIGDIVRFDNIEGNVEDISLRMVTIRDMDGTVHHVPHGEVKIVSNLSKNFARVNLDIGVSYRSNLEHVIKVVNQIGTELAGDDQWKPFIIKPPQFLRVSDFGESAIIIKILGETVPHRQGEVSGEFRKRIKMAFDKEGIEIPLPQRVIHQVK